MKRYFFGLSLLAVIVVAPYAWGGFHRFGVSEVGNMSRVCVFKAGTAETITSSSAASDSSAELDHKAIYAMTCKENAWVRWGASAPTAADGDIILWKETWLFFGTGGAGDIAYVAAKNVTTNGYCYILECQ